MSYKFNIFTGTFDIATTAAVVNAWALEAVVSRWLQEDGTSFWLTEV